MKTSTRIFLIICIVGLVFGFAGLGDTKLFLDGRTVDLTDPVDEFDSEALVQGDIDFVVGPFAVLETSHKTYGITTSKSETEFYIVSNLREGTAAVVMSVANTAMKKEMLAAADKWEKWLDSDDPNEPMPVVNISFKGKLSAQSGSPEYLEYYRDYEDFLVSCGFEKGDFALMQIVYGEVSIVSVIICFGGAAVFLVGLILLIVSFIKSKKEAKMAEYY